MSVEIVGSPRKPASASRKSRNSQPLQRQKCGTDCTWLPLQLQPGAGELEPLPGESGLELGPGSSFWYASIPVRSSWMTGAACGMNGATNISAALITPAMPFRCAMSHARRARHVDVDAAGALGGVGVIETP